MADPKERMPSGPLAVCATDDRLGDRIQAVLQQAGHETIGCALPLDQAFASAHASRAQALVLVCSQEQFVRQARIRAVPSSWRGIPLIVVATGAWNARGWRILRSAAEGMVREFELEQTLPASVDAVLADQLCLPRSMRDAL